ncbi:hypothetical protein OH76DRAFT_1561083 [Lentinus brumalis]|uniref:F-box domain-containing protein n=1 Tax=Lentinus brumalis TaxID=2498619 RepID=A0A371CPT2_9APHY|nr:hypothetical protein OH76DRAFT_1561083 [Polyporus brumalis]
MKNTLDGTSGRRAQPSPRLPNELLIDVFHAFDSGLQKGHVQKKARPRCRWISLMLVCRHWRALGVSTPSLWQVIEVGDNLRWVKLALARSAFLPIRLLFTDRFSESRTLSFMIPHKERIQMIVVDRSQTCPPPLQLLFHYPLPLLSEVDIATDGAAENSNMPHLCFAEHPMLRTLRLSFYPLPFDDSMFAQLHSMSLSDKVFYSKLLTLEDFSSALRRCARLKELRLHRVLRHLANFNPAPATESAVVALPKLRKLVIEDHPWTTSSFLPKLDLSPQVTLRLCIQWPGGLSDALYTESFDSLLPIDRSNIPILRSITNASIDCWHDSKVALKGRTDDAKITLKIAGSIRDPGTFYLQEAQEQFRILFDGAPLECLEIAGDWDVVPDIHHYLRFFAGYPALRSLKVSGCGSPTTLLRAFIEYQPYPAITTMHLSDSRSGSAESMFLICPHLSSLALKYVKWRQEFIDILLLVLRRRLEYGLPKLKELVLLAKSESPTQELSDTQLWRVLDAHLGDLQSLVTKLNYELVN